MKRIFISTASAMFAFALVAGVPHSAQAAKCVVVKNVVGKNYQTAQDIWRAQGLYVLPAKDGRGWGRLPFIDSNWKVIGQFPKAGTCVKKNSDVRATVIKYTD